MARAKRQVPKGVWFATKRLSSGEVVRYGYFGRGPGSVGLGREGTPEFFAKLAEVLRQEPSQGTVRHLVWEYKAKVLPDLRERTQRDYRLRLDKIVEKFGGLSLRAVAADEIARYIIEWRDEQTKSPRQADYLVQVLSVVLGWGVQQRKLAKNQAVGLGRLYTADRREKIWTPEQEQAFFDSSREPISRALVLAIETGQRQEDLLRLSWAAVKDNIVTLRQLKTGVHVAVPISPRLRRCLDEAPRGSATTILTTEKGLPWDPKGNGFRAAWRDACAAAGVAGVTFHDLRGTFATRRMADGWTTEDVALCTGHSLRDLASLERYVSRAVVAAKRAEAMAQRMAEAEK